MQAKSHLICLKALGLGQTSHKKRTPYQGNMMLIRSHQTMLLKAKQKNHNVDNHGGPHLDGQVSQNNQASAGGLASLPNQM
jgi:hypothetical protein